MFTTISPLNLLVLPRFDNLRQVYEGDDYRTPFNCPGVVHQCAIRLSIALQRCGFSLEDFPDKTRIHGTALRRCAFNQPHIVGANELMKLLVKRFGFTIRFQEHERERAYSRLSGRHGIVYFNNLNGKSGDHIDIFNGVEIFNESRNYPDHDHAGGAAPTGERVLGKETKRRYFSKASRIDFIELR